MQNIGQIGFDFGDSKPAFRAEPIGTWKEMALPFKAQLKRFDLALATLPTLEGLPHAVFEDALTAAIAEHAAQVKHCKYDADERSYTLWTAKLKYIAADIAKVIEHCRQNQSISGASVEYKVKPCNRGDVVAGMHAKDVGSVIAVMWAPRGSDTEPRYSLRFVPGRDSFFRESYDDGAESARIPESVWSRAYAAQTLAESGNKVPNVRTFVFRGREYVNTGGLYSGNYRQCHAWAITSAADWEGDTFTYNEMIKAYEDGRLQRGDHRGQLVRVRGQICVLESHLVAFDDDASTAHVMFHSGEEQEEGADDNEDDWEVTAGHEADEPEFA